MLRVTMLLSFVWVILWVIIPWTLVITILFSIVLLMWGMWTLSLKLIFLGVVMALLGYWLLGELADRFRRAGENVGKVMARW